MFLETSFLLIESDWPSDRTSRLLDGVWAEWIVVHRGHDGEDLYYPIKTDHSLIRLFADSTETVGSVLNLHESQALPTIGAVTSECDRPTVVVTRGRVSGILLPQGGCYPPIERGASVRDAPSSPPQKRQPPIFQGYLFQIPGLRKRSLETQATTSAQPSEVLNRAIEATAPPQVQLGETVPLVVKLVSESPQAGGVSVHGVVGDDVDVVVQASGGLEIQGKADGTLKLTASDGPMLLFKIKGTSIGSGEVSVLVFQNAQSVGCIEVAIQTVAQVSVSQPIPFISPLQPAPTQKADLDLLILESSSGGAVTNTIYFTAQDLSLELNMKSFSFSLQQDPHRFFEGFYNEIEQILASGATAKQKIQRLGSKGSYLFEQLLSPEAQAMLWKLRTRIRSVHIQSQEPWVPWELLKLSGDDGSGTVAEAGFLCEDYEVTRWVPGFGYHHDLTMSNIGVVIPPDSGLLASVPERDELLKLATPTRQVIQIDPEEVSVRNALASGTFDVIHFTGHGVAGATSADLAEIRLEGGSRLRPEDLTGVVANLGKQQPIVFLNACEIGRAGMGLTKPGGWPRAFLAAGAGAFIGPLWNVADANASTFAASFYEQFINGVSVGEAARSARLTIQAASDPTWLAYSVYAHCDARLWHDRGI